MILVKNRYTSSVLLIVSEVSLITASSTYNLDQDDAFKKTVTGRPIEWQQN